MWWQHVSLLWWSLVSVRCEVYQEISVLMLKRSVGKCISTAVWFFCLALFHASLCQNECKTGAEQQSQNHHIWNGLHYKRTMLSTPGHDNWNGKAYVTQRHMTRTFSATTARLVASWKWVYHSAGPYSTNIYVFIWDKSLVLEFQLNLVIAFLVSATSQQ